MQNRHRGRRIAARLNEIILRETYLFTAIRSRHVVHVVFQNRHASSEPSIRARGQFDLRAAIQHQARLRQRLIRFNLHFGLGAFHRAKVATGILHFVFQAKERRVVVRHLDVPHGRQVHHGELIAVRFHAPRFHVILHIFGNAREQKLVIGRLRFCQHGGLLPLGRTGILRKHAHLRSREAVQGRRDGLIATAANPVCPRFHANAVNRLAIGARNTSPKQRRPIA